MFTLIQLEYIVAIDSYKSFGKAAEHCFVTQPTLSMQVKKMEDYLGIKIFDRSKQPVLTTELGATIITQARKVLAEADRIKDIVDKATGDIAGTLHMGIIPTLGPYLLPLFAGNFKKKYPRVNLYIEELITEQIVIKIKNGQLDAGVFVTPYDDPAIIERALFYEEMLVYAHHDHPMLRKNTIRVPDMKLNDIWLLNDGHCFRSQVINLCDIQPDSRQELPYELEGGSLETLMRIIRREGGYTVIPELVVNDMAGEELDNVVRFEGSKPVREVRLCYSRNYLKQNLLQLIEGEIKSSVHPSMLDASKGDLVLWR